MNKDSFLETLKKRLAAFPEGEVETICAYYAEMIDDRVEEGMTEEEAVAALGNFDRLVEESLANLPLSVLMKAKVNESKKRSDHKGLWITLAILGSPLWLCLLLAFLMLLVSIYICIGAFLISAYVVLGSLVLSGVVSVIMGGIFLFVRSVPVGICLLGAGLILAGLGCLLVGPVQKFAKWLMQISLRIFRYLKSWFMPNKEAAQ